MVDAAVTQEPVDFQELLYAKSKPVLANMLNPELKEGKANNYKVLKVERARGLSIVTLQITKDPEVDIDAATADQVREVTVDYEHHNLQAVIEHYLGKGPYAVSALPTELDDLNEYLLAVTDRVMLDAADIEAAFNGNEAVLYVKDPKDLRWYGNARLEFVVMEGGSPEEPGKPSISDVVYDRSTGLLSANVNGIDEVTVSTSTGINQVLPISNNILSYIFEPILAGGTVISIDANDIHIEIKTPNEFTYVGFVRNSNQLMVNTSGDAQLIAVTTSYGYTNNNIPLTDGAVTHSLPDVPITSFDITITLGDLTQTITIVEGKPTGINIVGIPSEVTVGDVINYTVEMEPAGLTPEYNVSSNGSKYTVDKLNNTITILGTGWIDITFTAVNGFGITTTVTIVSKPLLTSIAFTTPVNQVQSDGILNIALSVGGTPSDAVIPNVVYTVVESSVGVDAEITGGNTLHATGVVVGSTVKVKAVVIVNGAEIVTEQTFTASE